MSNDDEFDDNADISYVGSTFKLDEMVYQLGDCVKPSTFTKHSDSENTYTAIYYTIQHYNASTLVHKLVLLRGYHGEFEVYDKNGVVDVEITRTSNGTCFVVPTFNFIVCIRCNDHTCDKLPYMYFYMSVPKSIYMIDTEQYYIREIFSKEDMLGQLMSPIESSVTNFVDKPICNLNLFALYHFLSSKHDIIELRIPSIHFCNFYQTEYTAQIVDLKPTSKLSDAYTTLTTMKITPDIVYMSDRIMCKLLPSSDVIYGYACLYMIILFDEYGNPKN